MDINVYCSAVGWPLFRCDPKDNGAPKYICMECQGGSIKSGCTRKRKEDVEKKAYLKGGPVKVQDLYLCD